MDEFKREEYVQIAPGLPVMDANGKPFGTIGNTIGEYVELRGGDQVSSMWIRRSAFGEANHEAVLLGFPSDDIGEHAVSEPPQTLEESEPVGVLEADADGQREAMLAELAEQRAEMHENGRATAEADETIGIPVEQEIEQRGVV